MSLGWPKLEELLVLASQCKSMECITHLQEGTQCRSNKRNSKPILNRVFVQPIIECMHIGHNYVVREHDVSSTILALIAGKNKKGTGLSSKPENYHVSPAKRMEHESSSVETQESR